MYNNSLSDVFKDGFLGPWKHQFLQGVLFLFRLGQMTFFTRIIANLIRPLGETSHPLRISDRVRAPIYANMELLFATICVKFAKIRV